MLDIQQVLKQDRLLRAMTGLNRKAFEALLETFSRLYEEARQKQPRQRAVGGGRQARLCSSQEKLFFILFYFKCYPTFDLAGIVFELHRSQVHEWMHRLQPLLEATLGEQVKRYNAVSMIYRNRIEAFDDRLMLTAAGLWNFYLMAA